MKGENKMIKQKELNMIQRGFVPILENSSCDPRILETLSIIHNYDPELFVHCINTEKYVRKTLDHLGKTDEELCMAALIDFPNEIPFQTATNEIKADIIFQPFETAREYHVNDKRYFRV